MEGSIGEKICALRKSNGMTQADLGKCLNISYQAVSKWERGESCPDFETLSKIAQLYGVSISFFEKREVETEANQPTVEDVAAVETGLTQEQKVMLGVCEKCGRVVYEGEQGEDEHLLICSTCWQKIVEQKEKEEKRNKEIENATRAEIEKISAISKKKVRGFASRGNGLILGGIIGGLVAAVIIWAGLSCDAIVGEAIGAGLLLGAFAFFYSSQMFWGGVVLSITTGGAALIGEPGVIFTLDLDGLFFLIGFKLLFFLLRIAIFLLTALGGILLAILISPFTFVPELLKA